MNFITFRNCIEKFIHQREENEDWLDKVDAAFCGAWDSICEHSFEDLAFDYLSLMMEDKNDWLGYFIYEKRCEWFEVYIREDEDEEERVVQIDSFEKLYDLIKGIL